MVKSDVQGGVISITPPNKYNHRILIFGVDTLHVGFYGVVKSGTIKKLNEKRNAPNPGVFEANISNRQKSDTVVKLGKTDFALKPHGRQNYAFLLFNEDLRLQIASERSDDFPVVYAALNASLLWREGFENAYWKVCAFMDSEIFKNREKEVVSRIDLCADFQGWEFKGHDLLVFVTRARRKGNHVLNQTWTGLTFGSRKGLSAKIYNKTMEIKQSGKEWFRKHWEKAEFDPELNVWRLEFSFPRSELRNRGISSVEKAFESLDALWNYSTREWLSYRKQDDSNRSRCSFDPRWETLQKIHFDGAAEGVAFGNEKRMFGLKRRIPGLAGHVTSCAAQLGEKGFDDAYAALGEEIKGHFRRKQTDFSVEVSKKMAQISNLETA